MAELMATALLSRPAHTLAMSSEMAVFNLGTRSVLHYLHSRITDVYIQRILATIQLFLDILYFVCLTMATC